MKKIMYDEFNIEFKKDKENKITLNDTWVLQLYEVEKIVYYCSETYYLQNHTIENLSNNYIAFENLKIFCLSRMKTSKKKIAK
jgi:hypothetical protein